MPDSKHSQGPFSICLGSGGNVCTAVRDINEKFIADFCPPYFLDGSVETVDILEQIANMNLFVAAPDLLAAIKRCVDQANMETDHDFEESGACADARAAIAKAEVTENGE